MEEREYILGTDRAELERLRFQHQAWVKEAYALWERAGLAAGQHVADLGCGPGYTSLELADVVGPTGRVIARDVSPRFLAFLRAECERRSCSHVETSLGPVEELDVQPESLDAAYARWLFCWLPDPAPAFGAVARGLRRGGALAFQDYLDWAAMKLVPRSEIFDRAVDACMRSWPDGTATIDIADHVPELAQRFGFRVEHFRQVPRMGRVGSLEWRWLGGFLLSYLPKLVQRGLFGAGELEAFRAEWRAATDAGVAFVCAPTVVDVILRKA